MQSDEACHHRAPPVTGSAQRERDGELVGDHVHPVEPSSPTQRGKEARRDIGHRLAMNPFCDATSRSVPSTRARVTQLELRKRSSGPRSASIRATILPDAA